ncbi:unnamed protein product [Angiostrongylus costaricensis]|uniref:Beta-N-acetylhexosaminidase n=1 Tax=Angiostrongylus costaricensis TaxID=334426 RepID=A0A0R3PCY3_ANGCS|nr:unnamed protein product [Angiostrongylus costaricensis]
MFFPRCLGVRNGLWIFAVVGLLVFVIFSLRVDDNTYGVFKRRRGGGPFDRRPFVQTIVHLDLKGAPPIPSVYTWLFPLLKKLGVHGVLIEYEDMFPYSGPLNSVVRLHHYDVSEIEEINKIAQMNDIEIIPLVQTFGHMEFILKHPPFAGLRESQLEVGVAYLSSRWVSSARILDLLTNL